MIKNVLSIAGSDPSGGAGIQADLKTFGACGVYGAAVITGLTAQNTLGVQGVFPVPPLFVKAQIQSVLEDVEISAIKIGMLGTRDVAEAVFSALEGYKGHIVFDPVMIAESGGRLVEEDAIEFIREALPRATLITPNLHEAATLLGCGVAGSDLEMMEQALRLAQTAKAVLLKGGHGTGGEAIDTLAIGKDLQMFSLPRILTRNTHGTGCTLSSAIAAYLAKGLNLENSVLEAKHFVHQALQGANDLNVGKGAGPLNHFSSLWT